MMIASMSIYCYNSALLILESPDCGVGGIRPLAYPQWEVVFWVVRFIELNLTIAGQPFG
jgi:hypothetical protein